MCVPGVSSAAYRDFFDSSVLQNRAKPQTSRQLPSKFEMEVNDEQFRPAQKAIEIHPSCAGGQSSADGPSRLGAFAEESKN
jgi:hypothetical protein